MSQELVNQTIKKFQDKLLDLSKRNGLLNFKFSEKSRTQIRIVNDSPNQIYKNLKESKKLTFATLPESGRTSLDENSARFQQIAERLGINPDYDLPSLDVSLKGSNLILQTLLFPEDFEGKALRISAEARSSIEETGRNILYLAFGMLEWFESGISEVNLLSPLLIYPVIIERSSERGQYRYLISSHEDEIEVNPCLREKLRRDFDLNLPDFEEDDSPEAYFQKIVKLIELKNQWFLRRFVTLSLFSFGNFALYKDIDPKNWANDGLTNHPIVSSLLGGGNSEIHDTFKIPSDYEVDKPEISSRVPLIISETDASQFSAIVDVMDGKNLVIEGPPGTGKSQTITNLIAAALAKGKTVLFVAEKMAAVEVVRNRLSDVGLRDFCLEIHSTGKSKVDIYTKEIKARCDRQNLTPSSNANDIEQEYSKNRQQLTDYVELLNQPFGAMGDENKIYTIQEIIWKAKNLQNALEESNIPKNFLSTSINNVQSLSRFDLERHLNLLKQFCKLKDEINEIDLYIWEGVNALDLNPIDQQKLIDSFKQWHDDISEILNMYQLQADVFNLPINPKLEDLLSLKNLLETIPELPDQIESNLLNSLNQNPTSIPLCRSFLSKYEEYDQVLQNINTFFGNEYNIQAENEELKESILTLKAHAQKRQFSSEKPISLHVSQAWEKDSQNSFLCEQTIKTYQEFKSLLNIAQDITFAELNIIDNILRFIANTPDNVLHYRNPQICDPSNHSLLEKIFFIHNQLVNLKKYIRLELCKDSAEIKQYAENHRKIWNLSCKFGKLWETNNTTFSFLQKILTSGEDAKKFIEINPDNISENIIHLDNILNLLENTPDSILSHLNPAICNPSSITIIDQAQSFQKQADEIKSLVRIELCQDIEWVRFCANKLRKKSGSILSLIDCDLQKAKRFRVKVGKSLKNLSDIEFADILEKVAAIWEQWNSFIKRDKFDEIAGSLYHKLDTNLDLCYQVNKFGMQLEEVIAPISCAESIKNFILNSSTSDLKTAIDYRYNPDFISLLQDCKITPAEHSKLAREFWSSVNIGEQNLSDLEVADTLTKVAECLDTYNNLISDNKIVDICGQLYQEEDTDYALALQVNKFGVDLEDLVTPIACSEDIKNFILNSSTSELQVVINYWQNFKFKTFLENCKKIIDLGISKDKSLSEASAILESQKQESEEVYQNFLKLNLKPDTSIRELDDLVSQFNNYERLKEELNSSLFTNVLGAYPNSEVFSSQALKGSLDWIERLKQKNLPESIKKMCLSSNVVSFVNSIQDFIPRYQFLIEKQDNSCKNVLNIGKIDCLLMFGQEKIEDCNAINIRDKLQSLDKIADLQIWTAYKNIKSKLESLDLINFVNSLQDINISEEQLDLLYQTIFYRSLVNEIYKTHSGLGNFEGQIQQNTRLKFQKLDKEILGIYQSRLALQLSQNQIPKGSDNGPRTSWTEQALINNEIKKKQRFAPLRRLFQNAGQSLKSLHPCWMMSPASVAQFLPSNSNFFDLVVIDEASQMRPEEGLGVIARGKQLVIVGDPKQLPPTDFFRSAYQVDESEDIDTETLQEESILDIAMKIFTVRRLKWHYRSRHESLIAFSNKHFYDDSLTLFPSPNRKFAIKYHHIADGLYQSKSSINPNEMLRVAEAILEFMKKSPELSLGVVTLNQKQKELLEDQVSLLVNNHAAAADYKAKWEGTLSSFFIKNLENVQGDERDVIFISTVYGRESPEGRVAQRFGPISQASGHRRLNVLFTRAKERIEVFSSMTTGDIRPTSTSSRGVHALRDYLEYIQTQQLETAKLTGREPDSDFEVFVAQAIRNKGFEVVAQVGVANYFIDLAIIDPNKLGTYLLGIECDGATYHSSKAARDRDRYRQEVLERLGWKIYRIWSTDWFKNSDKEIEKLLRYINEIMGNAY